VFAAPARPACTYFFFFPALPTGYVLSIARRTNSAIEAPVLLLSSSSRFICRGNKLKLVLCITRGWYNAV